MADDAQVLLLIGLGPDSDLPLAVRERADAAVVAARRAGVTIVQAALVGGDAGAADAGDRSTGDTVGEGAAGATAAGDNGGAPVAGTREAASELPADGRLDDGALATIALPGTRSVAVAGSPTQELVGGLDAGLERLGASLLVLDDACEIAAAGPGETDAAGGGPAKRTRRPASLSTEDWTASLDFDQARPRARRRRFVSIGSVIVILALIVAVITWSNHEAEDYFTLSPGSAPLLTTSASCQARGGSADLTLPGGKPCARVEVPASQVHEVDGSLFMVDVLEGRTTWSDWLLNKVGLLKTFRDGSQLFPASSILGSTPADELTCQNDQEMVQAQTDAPVAALQRLGYNVQEQDFGAQVDLVFPNYPAAAAGVACNDLITSVDGHTTSTVEAVSTVLAGKAPGTTVSLGVSSPDAKGGTSTRSVNVKLVPTPAEPGSPADPKQGFLGVELETRMVFHLPFDVSVAVGDIGGPSAGLALTLAIMNVLSNGKLTGGHHVAATGTIAPNGAVGDVGGVAQKTVAVRNAGATLFLVPPQELKAAQSEAGSKLKVVPVSSLAQALAALKAIGGQIPAPSTS